MNKIEIHLSGNDLEAEVEEKVYTDASCGQYEAGWLVCISDDDQANYGVGADSEYFVSETGDVYVLGTDEPVGSAPEIQKQAAEWDAKMDATFAEYQADSDAFRTQPDGPARRDAVKLALDKLLGRES